MLGLSGGYFFSGWGGALRTQLWRRLDKDRIYLKEGGVVYGWIWGETEDYLAGEESDGTLFNIKTSDYERVEENRLFYYLDKLI